MSKERLAGLVTFLFFLAVFLFAGDISGTTDRGLGPRFFPYAVSVLGMVLGLYLVVHDLLVAKPSGEKAPDEESAEPAAEESLHNARTKLRSAGPALAIVGLSVLYSLVWDVLGFITTSVAFLVLGLMILGERRPLVILLYSVGIVGVLYLIFRTWLQVPLPRFQLF